MAGRGGIAKENVLCSGVFRVRLLWSGKEGRLATFLSCSQGGSESPVPIPLICTGGRRIPTRGGTKQRGRIRRCNPPLPASGNLNPRP